MDPQIKMQEQDQFLNWMFLERIIKNKQKATLNKEKIHDIEILNHEYQTTLRVG